MIDTLKYANELKAAGVNGGQAEAMARALQAANPDRYLVTRGYLQQELALTRGYAQEQLAPIHTDIVLLKWMAGAALAGHVVTWSLLTRMLLH
jgi:hypothetical protein